MNKHAPGLNLNTVLLAVLLGLSGWTLKTLVEQGVLLATVTEKVAGQSRDINDLRTRMDTEERSQLRNAHYSPAPIIRPNA